MYHVACVMMQRKYIFHIVQPLSPVFHFNLRRGLFYTPQNIGLDGDIQAVGNKLPQHLCLIETTVAESGWVEGDGDKRGFVSS